MVVDQTYGEGTFLVAREECEFSPRFSSSCCYRLRERNGLGGRRFRLRPGNNSIGTGCENDVALGGITGVSRLHAKLCWTAEGLEIEDLKSRNGTFVNGRKIHRREIRAGDKVRIGPVELLLERLDLEDAELGLRLEASDPRPSEPTLPEQSTAAIPAPPLEDLLAEIPGELIFPSGYVVGESIPMHRFYRAMLALTRTDLPVLIDGETGVGKELAAKTLHLSSPRRHGPFVAVNCASIPAELLEAEMFGIDEGVATGVRKRPGLFLSAQGGTLFLDEIGEMAPPLQAKLLRALQEKEIAPLGGRTVAVDVRVVAATNGDLRHKVEQGLFRDDLFYRIAGSVLTVPPLRERSEDIPLLLRHFLRVFSVEAETAVRGVSVKALKRLLAYSWPGNVRELEHEVKRLVFLCSEGWAIESEMIASHIANPSRHWKESGEAGLSLKECVEAVERRAIRQALDKAAGSRRKAARLLGISRTTLLKKIENLGL